MGDTRGCLQAGALALLPGLVKGLGLIGLRVKGLGLKV